MSNWQSSIQFRRFRRLISRFYFCSIFTLSLNHQTVSTTGARKHPCELIDPLEIFPGHYPGVEMSLTTDFSTFTTPICGAPQSTTYLYAGARHRVMIGLSGLLEFQAFPGDWILLHLHASHPLGCVSAPRMALLTLPMGSP